MEPFGIYLAKFLLLIGAEILFFIFFTTNKKKWQPRYWSFVGAHAFLFVGGFLQ